VQDELELRDPAAVRALFDPLRFQLFGLLRVPRSIPELARAVGYEPVGDNGLMILDLR